MKNVVINTKPTDIVDVNEVDERKFYGVEFNSNGRAFVTRQGYKSGKFILVAFGVGMTYGNTWNSWNNFENLSDMFKEILDDKNRKIYEFDTAEELYHWIGQSRFHH